MHPLGKGEAVQGPRQENEEAERGTGRAGHHRPFRRPEWERVGQGSRVAMGVWKRKE